MGIALFVGIIAENVIPSCVFLGQAKIPVLMSIVIYYAMNRSAGLMLIAAMVGGILHDSLSAFPLGYSSLCFCVIGVVVKRYRNIVFNRKWITYMFFGALSGIALSAALYVLLAMTKPCVREASVFRVILQTAWVGIFGMVLTPPVFGVMRQFDLLVGNITVKDSE